MRTSHQTIDVRMYSVWNVFIRIWNTCAQSSNTPETDTNDGLTSIETISSKPELCAPVILNEGLSSEYIWQEIYLPMNSFTKVARTFNSGCSVSSGWKSVKPRKEMEISGTNFENCSSCWSVKNKIISTDVRYMLIALERLMLLVTDKSVH